MMMQRLVRVAMPVLLICELVLGLPLHFPDDLAEPRHSARRKKKELVKTVELYKKKVKQTSLLLCALANQLADKVREEQARTVFLTLNIGSSGDGCGHEDEDGDQDEVDENDSPNGGGGTVPGVVGAVLGQAGGLLGQTPVVGGLVDNVRPVFENPERYRRRIGYFPLFRALLPSYRLF